MYRENLKKLEFKLNYLKENKLQNIWTNDLSENYSYSSNLLSLINIPFKKWINILANEIDLNLIFDFAEQNKKISTYPWFEADWKDPKELNDYLEDYFYAINQPAYQIINNFNDYLDILIKNLNFLMRYYIYEGIRDQTEFLIRKIYDRAQQILNEAEDPTKITNDLFFQDIQEIYHKFFIENNMKKTEINNNLSDDLTNYLKSISNNDLYIKKLDEDKKYLNKLNEKYKNKNISFELMTNDLIWLKSLWDQIKNQTLISDTIQRLKSLIIH